jgi:diaminohydroxyphosphoribosylaminopyrimidine deaminase/5-amino-6-(5-phosphoribosylamino)uracil reductase
LGMANLGPYTTLQQGPELEFKSTERVGPDLRILAQPPGRDRFGPLPTAPAA